MIGITDVRHRATALGIEAKYLVLGYPLLVFLAFFGSAFVLLFVTSFYFNIDGGYFRPGFTLENYARFLRVGLYQERLVYTIRLAVVVTGLSLVVGYPLAYYIARTRRELVQRALMIVIVTSLWITYVIRAYAWTVLLSEGGIVSQLGTALGLLSEPTSFVPGYWAVVVGLVYVFLPFMILTLYNSIKNISDSYIEASKSLGAGRLATFRHVTLPLSKNGVVSGSLLVFLLTLGSYVLPRILGNPPQWTHAVIIADQVAYESNVPFAAALSIVLLVIVVLMLAVVGKLVGFETANLGGET